MIAMIAVVASLALASTATTVPPKVDFTVAPATPTVGLAASYQAVISPPNDLATVEWDFDGDPASSRPRAPGPACVPDTGREAGDHAGVQGGEGQGGQDRRGGHEDLSVNSLVATPISDPAPPQPDASAPGTSTSDTSDDPLPHRADRGATPAARSVGSGAQRHGPPGSGRHRPLSRDGLPLRPLRRRSQGRPVRVRGLERRLAARTSVEILVRQRGFVGKYTRFRIRAGGRSPLRDDRCLLPGRRTPVSCPFG